MVIDERDVHVWLTALDRDPASLEGLRRTLSSDERARAERFCFARDRDRFIAARGVLRNVLARYTGTAPERLRFRYGAHGKPSLELAGDLRFNLSHAGGLALCAVARGREVGVDIERVRADLDCEAIAARYFSPRERDGLRSLDTAHRRQAFFDAWTRKEALVKARGEGLAAALDRLDVSDAPLRAGGGCWSMRAIRIAPGVAAAVAAEGDDWRLSCRAWTD